MAASHERQIPAGGEGTISVKVDTSGYGGKELRHFIEVHTNDPIHRIVQLGVVGNVQEFMRISRRYVRFNGKAGETLSEYADILPVHPFKIIKVTAEPGKNIRVKWTRESQDNQAFYRVIVENKAKTATSYLEKIVIRTDSNIRREFIVPVHGNIQ